MRPLQRVICPKIKCVVKSMWAVKKKRNQNETAELIYVSRQSTKVGRTQMHIIKPMARAALHCNCGFNQRWLGLKVKKKPPHISIVYLKFNIQKGLAYSSAWSEPRIALQWISGERHRVPTNVNLGGCHPVVVQSRIASRSCLQ